MTTETKKGVEFDPGFAPYILVFEGTVQYIYTDINRFKNLSQKKLKFMQYYKKVLDVFYNNVGFYTGCLMWAAYIKSQDKQPILNNNWLGKEYDEESNVAETRYLTQFAELFHKDMKYYLGKDFSFDEKIFKLLKTYEEFLVINKGFTITEFNTDIKLPENVKTETPEKYKEIIDEVLKAGDLSKLVEQIDAVIQ